MKKSIRFAVTAALTLGTLSVGGQTYAADQDLSADEHSLGETVVTATRTPLSVRQTPANVAVVTAQEIEQNHYRSVSESRRHCAMYRASRSTSMLRRDIITVVQYLLMVRRMLFF